MDNKLLKPRFYTEGKSLVKSQRVLYYSISPSVIWKRNNTAKNLMQKLSTNKPAPELQDIRRLPNELLVRICDNVLIIPVLCFIFILSLHRCNGGFNTKNQILQVRIPQKHLFNALYAKRGSPVLLTKNRIESIKVQEN